MGAIAEQEIILSEMAEKEVYVVGDYVNGSLSFHVSLSQAKRELQDYIEEAVICGIGNGLSLEEAESEALDMFYMDPIQIRDRSSFKEVLYKTGRTPHGETVESFLFEKFGLMASVFV